MWVITTGTYVALHHRKLEVSMLLSGSTTGKYLASYQRKLKVSMLLPIRQKHTWVSCFLWESQWVCCYQTQPPASCFLSEKTKDEYVASYQTEAHVSNHHLWERTRGEYVVIRHNHRELSCSLLERTKGEYVIATGNHVAPYERDLEVSMLFPIGQKHTWVSCFLWGGYH